MTEPYEIPCPAVPVKNPREVRCPGSHCMDGRCSSDGLGCKGTGHVTIDFDPWAWSSPESQAGQDAFVKRYHRIGREMWEAGMPRPRGRRPAEGWDMAAGK